MGRKLGPADFGRDLESLLRESLATADATHFLETAAHIAMAVDAFHAESADRLAGAVPSLKSAPF